MSASGKFSLDPPDHTRIRNFLNKAFSPEDGFKPKPNIESLYKISAGQIIKITLKTIGFHPMAIITVAEMFGTSRKDRDILDKWASAGCGTPHAVTFFSSQERSADNTNQRRHLLKNISGILLEQKL